MYFMPQPMKCPKCGHTGNYSEHHAAGPIIGRDLICPRCYADFIRTHCGVMRPTPSEADDHGGAS